MTRFIGYRLGDQDNLMIRCECGTLYEASDREVSELMDHHPDLALRLAWNSDPAPRKAA